MGYIFVWDTTNVIFKHIAINTVKRKQIQIKNPIFSFVIMKKEQFELNIIIRKIIIRIRISINTVDNKS